MLPIQKDECELLVSPLGTAYAAYIYSTVHR
jgi:hypothetical protein